MSFNATNACRRQARAHENKHTQENHPELLTAAHLIHLQELIVEGYLLVGRKRLDIKRLDEHAQAHSTAATLPRVNPVRFHDASGFWGYS